MSLRSNPRLSVVDGASLGDLSMTGLGSSQIGGLPTYQLISFTEDSEGNEDVLCFIDEVATHIYLTIMSIRQGSQMIGRQKRLMLAVR